MEIVFWVCVAGAAYSYFVYPIILLLGRGSRLRSGTAQSPVSSVSVIVAARNEARQIAGKLDNTLALQSPGVPIEVIVASDASDDATDDIVRGYADRGVLLARSPERRGKEHAQKFAFDASRGDIVVFTDAGTILPADSLIHVVAAFGDPRVGAVSSVDRIIAPDGTVGGEGLYLRYEMWLRDLETAFGSLVGLSGSFFAARRAVCVDWDSRVPSDFGTALNCIRLGYRAVSDRKVIGIYKTIADPGKEYMRKVRTVARGMRGLVHRREVLNPLRFGRFAFEVFSHKVMRWAVPWFLLVALCASATLAASSSFYAALFAAQVVAYLLPVLARFAPGILAVPLLRPWVYFVEVNAALVHSALRTLRGSAPAAWEPSKR
jgi:glycosyltransferase involved in cell wall biosynthesis